jgi:hypothetical protein
MRKNFVTEVPYSTTNGRSPLMEANNAMLAHLHRNCTSAIPCSGIDPALTWSDVVSESYAWLALFVQDSESSRQAAIFVKAESSSIVPCT